MQLTVLTFNIHHGKGTDGQLNMRRLTRILKESHADIIGLNEVDKHFSRRSNYLDQITYIADHLQMHSAFGPSVITKKKTQKQPGEYGNALLSRYPIIQSQNHLFRFYAGILEGRALLESTLQIHRKKVKVWTTHLSLNPYFRLQQASYLIQQLKKEQHPTLLLGDWNMKPDSRTWKKITSQLRDSCEVAGVSLPTFPSFYPKVQLDYIFISKEFTVSSVEVIEKFPMASDHLPLLAKLTL